MKALFAAATLAASLAGVAFAQNYPQQPPPGAMQPPPSAAQPPPEAQPPTEPAPPPQSSMAPQQSMTPQPDTAALSETINDAKSTYTEAQVRGPRRAYRAACQRYESRGFCDCVTAGVAQALPPDMVRMAARTVGERITAQGSGSPGYDTDARIGSETPQERIQQVEGHYADACQQLRK
jgi:hypothetical protein